MTQDEINFGKQQILQAYQLEYQKYTDSISITDGYLYKERMSVVMRQEGSTVKQYSMSKEEFPEYFDVEAKWNAKKKELTELIIPFAKYKIGDIAITYASRNLFPFIILSKDGYTSYLEHGNPTEEEKNTVIPFNRITVSVSNLIHATEITAIEMNCDDICYSCTAPLKYLIEIEMQPFPSNEIPVNINNDGAIYSFLDESKIIAAIPKPPIVNETKKS